MKNMSPSKDFSSERSPSNEFMTADFDIRTFFDFRNLENQYTDDFIRFFCAVKVYEDEELVKIAVKKSNFQNAKKNLTLYHCEKQIEFIEVSDADFEEFAGHIFSEKSDEASFDTKKSFNLDNTSESDVVNIINSILLEGIRSDASDIHFEPFENEVKVRFRIDGVLKTARNFPSHMEKLIVNRLKIMANLNIMECRLAQDGHIETKIDGELYDLRISFVPVVFGESCVIRIFNANSKLPALENLGFSEEILAQLEKVPTIPNGMVLFTGPTGSGKTTTMHSILEKMDKEKLKIITIEDPIERNLKGVCQIQVNDEIGFTFDSILAKVLRQDPNVIMIGEIRDKETANLALRSSLTGHLILATVHANDSSSVIERLENLGLEPYMIASVLRLIVSQRLVRKVFQNNSYKGRTVVSEMLLVDSLVAEKIAKGEKINRTGKSLLEDAKEKMEKGITTKEELIREGLWNEER